LLTQLKDDAESEVAGGSADAKALTCSSCNRPINVDERWEACPACWRTYCPECLTRIHPPGGAFFCPACGKRKS